MSDIAPLHGIMAEFSTPEAAAAAARGLRENGFTKLDAYGPFPSDDLAEAIGFKETKMAKCVLLGGIVGGLCGYALQYWVSVLDYPHNIGGRPNDSWPAFIPVTFECTVLFASVTGIVSLLIMNRLPRLSHPVFSSPRFAHASSDHFFLCVIPNGSEFSVENAQAALEKSKPLSISILREESSP